MTMMIRFIVLCCASMIIGCSGTAIAPSPSPTSLQTLVLTIKLPSDVPSMAPSAGTTLNFLPTAHTTLPSDFPSLTPTVGTPQPTVATLQRRSLESSKEASSHQQQQQEQQATEIDDRSLVGTMASDQPSAAPTVLSTSTKAPVITTIFFSDSPSIVPSRAPVSKPTVPGTIRKLRTAAAK
jgi:hypothetical protein